MDSEKQQDQWADLLGNLDIEAREEESPQPPAPELDPPVTQPPIAHSAPAQPASDWDGLASDLGLELEEKSTAPVAEEPEPRKPVHVEPQSIEQRPLEFTRPVTPVEQPIRARVDEPERGPVADVPAPPAPKPVVKEKTPDTPAGFGTGALTLPDWFPFGGKKKQKPAEPTVDEPAPDSTENEDVAADSADTAAASGEEEQPRGKRRRGRRRGGRGRSRHGASKEGQAEQSPGESDSQHGSQLERSDSTNNDLADGSPHEVTRARAVSHKSIPSWQEAIGVVVDANIAARGERKRAYRGSGRSGSSRGGRSRGRRKKKES